MSRELEAGQIPAAAGAIQLERIETAGIIDPSSRDGHRGIFVSGKSCAKPHRPAGEAPSNRNSSTSSCRRGGNQDEGSASWPPCSAHTRHGTFKLVNGHVEVNVSVSRSRKDWVRLLLDRLKLANDSSHPCFNITGCGLEIDRHIEGPFNRAQMGQFR
jgi:hypothetical protein